MDQQPMREHCNLISTTVMKMHPLCRALEDETAKGEIVKALFEITKNVEIVKKQMMRLEKRDDSALL